VGGLIAGIVAVVVGGALAVATTIGVVNTVEESPASTDASVVDYGSSS
jgi:Asp/Glu/hydantoin racemase